MNRLTSTNIWIINLVCVYILSPFRITSNKKQIIIEAFQTRERTLMIHWNVFLAQKTCACLTWRTVYIVTHQQHRLPGCDISNHLNFTMYFGSQLANLFWHQLYGYVASGVCGSTLLYESGARWGTTPRRTLHRVVSIRGSRRGAHETKFTSVERATRERAVYV